MKDNLKSLLTQCTDGQHSMFKRMYSNENMALPIDVVVDRMTDAQIRIATRQVENTIIKNKGNFKFLR